jgi:large-conductance mechanosensitive channel
VVGGVIAFIIIGIVVFFVVRRSNKNRDEGPQPEYQHQGGSVNSRKSPLASPTSDLNAPIEVQNAQLRPYVSFFKFLV